HLTGPAPGGGIRVVAVALAYRKAVAVGVDLVGAGESGPRRAQAVVVQAIADLRRAGIDGRPRVVTVAPAGAVVVPVLVEPFVEEAVAVVVDLIADLCGPRVGGRAEVVAISLALGEAVTIVIHNLGRRPSRPVGV